MDSSGEEVTTVFVGGFPLDTMARELDNLCRFMPGFQSATHRMGKGLCLWALFDSTISAHVAIEILNGQCFDRAGAKEPMRAMMAKSNMKNNSAPMQGPAPGGWGGGAPPGQLPPPSHGLTPFGGNPFGGPGQGMQGMVVPPSAKRPRDRVHEDPGQIDTVASVGAFEKGIDEETLRGFFESCPGYLEFKPNHRNGGGFAKFASPHYAMQTIQMAQDQGIPCSMAKSSMGSGAAHAASAHGQGGGGCGTPGGGFGGSFGMGGGNGGGFGGGMGLPGGAGGGSWQAAGRANSLAMAPPAVGNVDTIASVGAAEAGVDEDTLRNFFQNLEGFLAFKPNPRMGGGFTKFATPQHAQQALQIAKDSGVPAAMAKSSMSA